MAKKQLRRQRGKKQQPTLKKQISSNLSKRANKLIEHYENVDALRAIGDRSEKSNLLGKLGSIFDTTEKVPENLFPSKVEDILHKLKTLKKLIILNITRTEDKKNFDTPEYVEDRKVVVDIEFKIQSTSKINSDDLKLMNKLYKKHKQVKQLFD